ncbi:DUF397 domain-containing protein [Nocardia noduli]|uniref:DUF397 domain-containing protein n=1 Tax=Nocardia noduli TaxID=2815722 RepID=UPI001C222437|nr:DUF397 domain-containing protein [Nocardia noduli]
MATTATFRSVCISDWFTSSRSNNGNQCVEVRFVGDVVSVRDSKYRRDPAALLCDEPIITVTATEWTSFLTVLASGGSAEGPTALTALTTSDGATSLRHGEITLTYTPEEWNAFIAGVRDGEFDRVVLPA